VRILLNCIHVVAALVMIVVVLLQQGKGADIGAAFGAGSSQTLFGSRGAGNFLTKMTTAFVVIFMGTSIALSYLTTPRSVLDTIEPPAGATPTEPAPAEPPSGSGDTPSGFESVPAPDAKQDGAAEPSASAPVAEPAPAPTPAPESTPPASDSTGR